MARERLPELLGEQGDFEGAFLLESPDGLVVVTDREIRFFDEAAWDEEQTSAPEPVETIAIGGLTDVSHPSFWNPVKVRFLTGFMTRRTRWKSSPVAAKTAPRVEHELDFTTRAEGSRFASLVDRVKEASRGRDGIQFLYQSGRGYPLSEGAWLEGKSERDEPVLATRDGGTEIRMPFAQVRAIDLGVDTVRTTELFWGNPAGLFAVQDWAINKTVEFVTSVATTKNDVTTVRIVTDQGEVNLITADGSPTAIETSLNEGRHHQGDPPSEGPPSTATWFADPTGRHEYRLWDGQDWTDQVADHGTTATDPLPARPADGSDPPPSAP